MTKYEELLRAVTADPDDDAARLAFATHIRPWEPDRAEFIERQIDEARQRRASRDWVKTSTGSLLRKYEPEWTRTIAKYARSWKFDRGFVTMIEIEPYLFLEHGEWLFLNAPIRDVEFVAPEEGDFPMQELADSRLLEHLDAITLKLPKLTEKDLEILAASPHLTRTLFVSGYKFVDRVDVDPRVYEAFAAAPLARKMLGVLFTSKGFPGQSMEDTGRDDWWGAPILDWSEVRPEGKALENKYGYIPWLHPEQNRCEPFDAAYYVANGILPVKPAGSPVD